MRKYLVLITILFSLMARPVMAAWGNNPGGLPPYTAAMANTLFETGGNLSPYYTYTSNGVAIVREGIFADSVIYTEYVSAAGARGATNIIDTETCASRTIQIQNMPYLTNISFTALEVLNAGALGSVCPSMQSMSFPALKIVTGPFPHTSSAQGNLFNSFSAPLLEQASTFFLTCANSGTMTNLSLPRFARTTGASSITQWTNLTDCTLPALVYSGGWTISASPKLTNLVLGTPGVVKTMGNLQLITSKLNLNSISNTLAVAVGMDGTGGSMIYGTGMTINVSGGQSVGTNFWTQYMMDLRSTLTGRTCTVTANTTNAP